MTVIVRTDVPILLDPIICHAWQESLESYLPFRLNQESCQTAAGDAFPAVLQRNELPVVRLMAKKSETSTLEQTLIGLNCRHDGLLRASDFCYCFFPGSSQRCCFLSVREVGI